MQGTAWKSEPRVTAVVIRQGRVRRCGIHGWHTLCSIPWMIEGAMRAAAVGTPAWAATVGSLSHPYLRGWTFSYLILLRGVLMQRNNPYPARDSWPGLWDAALRQVSPGDWTPQTPQPARAQPPEAALSAWRRHDSTHPGLQQAEDGR